MDITKNIAIDEHYTITSSSVDSEFLKGAIVGSIVTSIGNNIKVRVPEDIQAKTIIVKRSDREKNTGLIIFGGNNMVEEIKRRRKDISSVKSKVGNPMYPLGIKTLPFPIYQDPLSKNMLKDATIGREGKIENILRITQKKELGVQTATVFRNVEQIATQRRIETQKKELRRDLKKAVLNNELLKKNVNELNRQLSSSKKELKLLKGNLMNNYVTKSYHLKQLSRLQATLQKYAHMATGISAYSGEFVTGGEVGELTRARRKQQVVAMEQLQQTRKENKLGSFFNNMGMKSRR